LPSGPVRSVLQAPIGRQRVHVGQVRQHFLLERHGHGHAAQRQLAHHGQQVVQRAGPSAAADGVHVLARKAVLCISGESEWAMGLPATPKMRVAWSSCSMR
jgi:hypothetical protein